MPKTVLIAGAGQLGSRHLQGLAAAEASLRIFVHDPSNDSLARAEARWREMPLRGGEKHVDFTADISELPDAFDVAIVATAADVRPAVVRDIGQRSDVRHWLLEKVLAQSAQQVVALNALTRSSVSAWVNTPRRMMRWHEALRGRLSGGAALSLAVEGGEWGLACNAVHFLDLVQWWTGASLRRVVCDELAPVWLPAKRVGYWEVNGTLTAEYDDGSVARLTAQGGARPMQLHLRAGDVECTIDEAAGTAVLATGERLSGRVERQSELTGAVVDALLRDGRCALPTLAASAALHVVYLDAMLAHWNAHQSDAVTELPIT